jgi:hypothetical protein
VIATPALLALSTGVLRSVDSIPAHLAGRFRDATGFERSAAGQYFVFDRRSQIVFGIDANLQSVWEIVHIGSEPGRIINPVAFASEPSGTFVVADTPNNQERIQIFTPVGFRIGGFVLPGRMRARVVLDGLPMNGIGSLQYTGKSILLSHPDTGSLITEYSLAGTPIRSFGALRHTGHEDDQALHVALNGGLPVIDPRGGFFFVFQSGEPVFRKYDDAELVFERRIQGREIDDAVSHFPTRWPAWSEHRRIAARATNDSHSGRRRERTRRISFVERSPTNSTRTATRCARCNFARRGLYRRTPVLRPGGTADARPVKCSTQ